MLCPTRTMGGSHPFTFGLPCSTSRSARPKSCTSSGLLAHFAQSASYPKLNSRTPLKSKSLGSHSLGQKVEESLPWDHVEREPPPRPCANTRPATTGWKAGGSKSRPSPYSSFSSEDSPISPNGELRPERREKLVNRLPRSLSELVERLGLSPRR